MQHIETIELDSSQSSITFSSIPQDYDDLVVLIYARTTRATVSDFLDIQFNGSSANQSCILLNGDGSAIQNYSLSSLQVVTANGANTTSNTFANGSVYVSNYTSSSAKSVFGDSAGENNATNNSILIASGRWNDTAAITSLAVVNVNSANLVSGSTFSLYGVTAGGDGTVTTS